jgi:hypothetical protein
VTEVAMAQCESMIFFPDDPAHYPQFTDCPREANTARRTFRFIKGEPITTYLVKLCSVCAREWDEHALHAGRTEQRVKAVGA